MQSNGNSEPEDEENKPKNEPDSEICYILYEQCVSKRTEPIPCDDCLRICLANQGMWPFDKCPIPPKRRRKRKRRP